MLESLTIAAFVFGAVLMLLSLVGGGFKLFGAEVPRTAGTLGRTVAFVLGGVLITVGLLREDSLRFVESEYQALIQSIMLSEGRCSGTVSPDGMQMISTCHDSVCGQFTSSAVWQ